VQKVFWRPAFSLALIGFLVSCGGGNVTVNREAGKESAIPLADRLRDQEEAPILEFFEDNIFPIIAQGNLLLGGCATSGCHLAGDELEPSFFQVDPDDVQESWQWARFRRTILEQSDYTNPASKTLREQMNATPVHGSFDNWTTEQRALLEEFSDLP